MKEKIEKLEKEIFRIRTEIVMGGYNGNMMTQDYEKKLSALEEELKELEKDNEID